MKRIYLFPKTISSENPYIADLEFSLSLHFRIVNKKSNTKGVLDLVKYILRTDIFYLNWIENLPSRRFGKAQVALFAVFLSLARLLGKKVLWTLHNKYSHDSRNNFWVDFMFRMMFKNADLILTHSQSGLDFANSNYPVYANKVKYFIHPVKKLFPENNNIKHIYDFFIWGTIWPYKGIVEFLSFLKDNGSIHFKILIAGICINEQVKKELEEHLTENVIYIDKFFDLNEIADLSNQSKFTLFTYNPESVLSSGSLMDSIAMRSVIIGPDAGAFRDLSSFGFVKTYRTYYDIIEIYNNSLQSEENCLCGLESFWRENNWEVFGNKLSETISTVFYNSAGDKKQRDQF